MTNKEKIESYKEIIVKLYEQEGRSKSYISRLLSVDRKILIDTINNEWNLIQSNKRNLSNKNQKFYNKNSQRILKLLYKETLVSDIAQEFGVSKDFLVKTIFPHNEEMLRLYQIQTESKHIVEQIKTEKKKEYSFEDLEGEVWKPIKNRLNYYVSNMGRFKHYLKNYDCYRLLEVDKGNLKNPYPQCLGFKVSRLVANMFVEGRTEERNIVNHKDGNTLNNKADNLEWVTIQKNTKHSYDVLKQKKTQVFSKFPRFKKIILNDKYEFKTLTALAKFMNISTSQLCRMIDGVCDNKNNSFKFVY